MTYAIVVLNVALFVLCAAAGYDASPSTSVLYSYGAITNDTLALHEYWRLLAAAFLHASLAHILTNMVCLVSWGAFLEQRIGSIYFVSIYLIAAIAGNIGSIIGHHEPYISVGASGAISGLIGALLAMKLLGKTGLSAQFFVTNIGLNVVLMSSSGRIDWMSHLGGFLAGLVVCGLLSLTVGLGARSDPQNV